MLPESSRVPQCLVTQRRNLTASDSYTLVLEVIFYFELNVSCFSFSGHLQVSKLTSSISDFCHNVRCL